MKNTQYQRYLKGLIFLLIAFSIIIPGFNWFVDPYGIYNSPKIDGFNSYKPARINHARILKAYAITKIKPEAICLGTSRAEVGINPDNEGWSYAPVYDLALPSAGIYEIYRYFQHANNTQPLRQVLLFLDFLSFDTSTKNEPDFNESYLSVSYDGKSNDSLLTKSINYYLPVLFSLDTLGSSITTIKNQTGSGFFYKENGALTYDNSTTKKGYGALFEAKGIVFFKKNYLPEHFQFDDTQTKNTPFEYYRLILRVAYQNHIDLRLALSPCHARQWEILAARGLWPQFEEWKLKLVEINAEEAYLANKSPFPLWDFAIYNEYTTEPVPALGDTKTAMQWYWESSHFKKELGDLVLDCIFGRQQSWEGTLGVLLTSENIDAHILDIRKDRQTYRDTHPDDIAEINKIARENGNN